MQMEILAYLRVYLRKSRAIKKYLIYACMQVVLLALKDFEMIYSYMFLILSKTVFDKLAEGFVLLRCLLYVKFFNRVNFKKKNKIYGNDFKKVFFLS